MNAMHGYAITFAVVPARGFDGGVVYRSSYTITGPQNELVESIQGSVEHALKSDALDEAQMVGERRLSSLAEFGMHHAYHQSWRAS